MFTQAELRARLKKTDKYRHRTSLSSLSTEDLTSSILNSWRRSMAAHIPSDQACAPLTVYEYHNTPLKHALEKCQIKLEEVIANSSMLIGVADTNSTLIWTTTNKKVTDFAHKINFIEGGHWAEDKVGTNAVALALETKKSSCVFANEHYLTAIHDLVCYAAPIIDNQTQQVLGVVNLSTKWKDHNKFGLLAAEHCANVIQMALNECQEQQLYIHALGTSKVTFQGRHLTLTPRQVEILTILALCPNGMTLAELHQALYGDRKVSLGTLKTEISYLRNQLNGLLGSRPYKILVPVDGDFLQAESALDTGCLDTALNLYQGNFLLKSDSPFLINWRNCFEYRLSQAIYNCDRTDLLIKHFSHKPDLIDISERLMDLIPPSHPLYDFLSQNTL